MELVVLESALVLEFEDLFCIFGVFYLPRQNTLFHFAIFHNSNKPATIFAHRKLTLPMKHIAPKLPSIANIWRNIFPYSIKAIIHKIPNKIPPLSKILKPFTISLSINKFSLNNRFIFISDNSISMRFLLLVKGANIETVFYRFDGG